MMWTLRRTSSKSTCRVEAGGLRARDPREPTATDRQERIPGFDQARLRRARVGLVGAGGINSEIGRGLARKGVGALDIFDDDTVTLSNYSRQAYYPKDLYRKKALRLPQNLARECVVPTVITGHVLRFEDALDQGIPMDCDLYVFGVDNNRARVAGCRTFLGKKPVLFLGTDANAANNAYVFVQEPGEACFACLFPRAVEDSARLECAASSMDILKAIAGLALYAVDSLIMDRPRHWNYREVFLDGSLRDRTLWRDPSPQCPVCGGDGHGPDPLPGH